MSFDYDDKGKIFTDVITKRPVYVTIQTTSHMMRGYFHVRRDQRIKDELDLDEKFLAATDVSILAPDGHILFQVPFLAINRAHIIWVLPEQEKEEGKGS